ncbi:MAG: hypothetical protein C0482_22235 [Gordonia sp.]|nr:hypothetical protein [Gordonia sp. (in: high G+C Gram-positive bacteria)]
MLSKLSSQRPRRRALIAAATAAVCMVPVLAGCTSSGGEGASAEGDSECISKATDFIAPYEALPTQIPDAFTPLNAPPPKQGSVVALGVGSLPFDIGTAEAVVDAAKQIGWQGQAIAHDGSVEDLNRKLQQALDQKPTAILLQGQPVGSILPAVERAKAEGVILAIASIEDKPSGTSGYAASSNGPNNFALDADIQANWIMKDSKCTGNALMVGLPFPILKASGDQFLKTMTADCPDCKSDYMVIQSSQAGTPAATNSIVSALQADPSIKYVGVQDGSLGLGLSAALKQAGITGVKIIGLTPGKQNLATLKSGDSSMWLTLSNGMAAWALMDAVLRVGETGQATQPIAFPPPMLTSDNVPSEVSDSTTFPADYQAQFLQRWKVTG